jgi:hypothetical protein
LERNQRGPVAWGWIVRAADGELVGLASASDAPSGLEALREWARDPRGFAFLIVARHEDMPDAEIIPTSDLSSEARRLVEPYRVEQHTYPDGRTVDMFPALHLID